jgi:hypothetical protein
VFDVDEMNKGIKEKMSDGKTCDILVKQSPYKDMRIGAAMKSLKGSALRRQLPRARRLRSKLVRPEKI